MFIISGGSDTITDYSTEDKISVSGSLRNGNFAVDGGNVILSAESDSLTIVDGADKVITFADKTTAVYTADGRFNEAKTALTLSAETQTFSAENYSELVTMTARRKLPATIKIIILTAATAARR